jgi:hypothetical protein
MGVFYSSEKLLAMLTAYCDDSGGIDHGFTVICGFVSTVAQWDKFEVDWKIMLADHNVLYLHMKEYVGSSGPYAKWKDKPGSRAAFLRDAAAIIADYVEIGFISYAGHKEFDFANKLFLLDELFGSPHGLAGRICMDYVNQWKDEINYPDELRYVFEDGRGKGDVARATKSVMPFLPTPNFEASRDVKPCPEWPEGRKAIVQLQAADYLAYETRKAARDRNALGIAPHRLSLRALLNTTIRMGGVVEVKKMCRFCYAKDFKRRLPEGSEIYEHFK